jgi:threonine dehydrogenase-like Zn-dependent dehydrogenase
VLTCGICFSDVKTWMGQMPSSTEPAAARARHEDRRFVDGKRAAEETARLAAIW